MTPHKKDPILTVGSLAFDSIRTPEGQVDHVLGGSCNYFSVAASFYAPVRIVGVVGNDFPGSHLEWLSTRGIDTSGVQVVPGKTFHWTGSYGSDLNEAKTLKTELNVFEKFDPVLSADAKKSPYVFLANIDPVLQHRVLDQVESPRLVACDSMNFWITGKPDELRKTLKRVDILSINEGEAALLSGETNLVRAAKKIRAMGPGVIVIKQGEYGVLMFTPAGIFSAPAFPLEKVVDPTGAGDTFAGAFVGYLAREGAHRDLAKKDPSAWETLLRRAVFAGCVLASFTVEDFSLNRLTRLRKEELEERRQTLLKMIQVP